MKSRSSFGRRLRLESLESRQMLSANVVATLSGGNLTLTGSKADAYVEVHETAANTFQITGLNGTTITYGTKTGSSETVAGVTGNLTANLPGSGSGTQSFELDTATSSPETMVNGNVCITMGNESDTVTIFGALEICGNTSISTGGGNAVVTAGKNVSFGGALSICTGNGNACIDVYYATIAGNLTINTLNGNQTIAIGKLENIGLSFDVTVDGSTCIQTGAGNSTVTILDTAFEQEQVIGDVDVIKPSITTTPTLNPGDVCITLGAGNNAICIGTSADPYPSDVIIDGNCCIQTSTGNTAVSIISTSISDNLNIVHGAGNTSVVIGARDPYLDGEGSDIEVGGNVCISTSTGNATIVIGGSAVGDSADISGKLAITTGSGNASISLTDDIIDCSLCIVTGSGNASITLTDDLVYGAVAIDTGTGNATINLSGDNFGSTLSVVLSGGGGSLTITHTDVTGSTTLNGGGGATLYYDATDLFAGGLHYSNFKKVTT